MAKCDGDCFNCKYDDCIVEHQPLSNNTSKAAYNKRVYQAHKQQGLCVGCHTNKAADGQVYCDECRQRASIERKEKRKYRKTHGQCVDCGKLLTEKDAGYASCEVCRQRQAARKRMYRAAGRLKSPPANPTETARGCEQKFA